MSILPKFFIIDGMSSRRWKSRVKHLEHRIQELSQTIPSNYFVASPILEGDLPLFPESQEYQTVSSHAGQRGISPNSIAMVTRGHKLDGRQVNYTIYPYHGVPTKFKISHNHVLTENNIFHHPETLVQTTLPHSASNLLKRDNLMIGHNDKGKLRVDQYFR